MFSGCLIVQTVARLEEEEDINQIKDYFSYEHFYVIYCKFWELDKDHDLFIDKNDLSRHNDHGRHIVFYIYRKSQICTSRLYCSSKHRLSFYITWSRSFVMCHLMLFCSASLFHKILFICLCR